MYYLRDDLPLWRCGEGNHVIDIIPFLKKNGQADFYKDIYVHRNVGGEGAMVLCRYKMKFKPCPICAYCEQTSNDTLIRNLKPSRRTLYNIIVYDSDRKGKGICIWDVSWWLFGRYLENLCKVDGKKIVYTDLDDGRSIAFSRRNMDITTRFEGIRFKERNYKMSDSIFDSSYDLNEVLIIPSYEQVLKIFNPNEVLEYSKFPQRTGDTKIEPMEKWSLNNNLGPLLRGTKDGKYYFRNRPDKRFFNADNAKLWGSARGWNGEEDIEEKKEKKEEKKEYKRFLDF